MLFWDNFVQNLSLWSSNKGFTPFHFRRHLFFWQIPSYLQWHRELCCVLPLLPLWLSPISLIPLLLLFSHPAVSDSLQPHGLQHTRPPCPLPSPGVCPSSRSLHWWCCPTISSSDALFSFCPQSFPASETFPMSHLFTSDDQKYWNFNFSISPSSECSGLISIKIDWFNSLAVQGTFRILLQHQSLKASILWHSVFFTVQFSPLFVTTGETTGFTIQTFVGRVMSLLFNTLSRFVIAFLPRSSHLVISWLQSSSAVILELKKRKSDTTPTVSPSICHANI